MHCIFFKNSSRRKKMNHFAKTRSLVMTAVIAAIIVIMAFVPFLGYIPLGFMNAATLHIPVIIGAILLGPKYGAFLGLTFGLTSLWKNTFMPNPTSFVFSPFVTMGPFRGNGASLIVCLVPRVLIGIVAYYVYRFCMKTWKEGKRKQGRALFVAGVAGSMTNTLLVMNFIYLFFGDAYAKASSLAVKWIYGAILGVIGFQGVPEAIVAGILVTAVTRVMLRMSSLGR